MVLWFPSLCYSETLLRPATCCCSCCLTFLSCRFHASTDQVPRTDAYGCSCSDSAFMSSYLYYVFPSSVDHHVRDLSFNCSLSTCSYSVIVHVSDFSVSSYICYTFLCLASQVLHSLVWLPSSLLLLVYT